MHILKFKQVREIPHKEKSLGVGRQRSNSWEAALLGIQIFWKLLKVKIVQEGSQEGKSIEWSKGINMGRVCSQRTVWVRNRRKIVYSTVFYQTVQPHEKNSKVDPHLSKCQLHHRVKCGRISWNAKVSQEELFLCFLRVIDSVANIHTWIYRPQKN